jgi:hypothetical protein
MIIIAGLSLLFRVFRRIKIADSQRSPHPIGRLRPAGLSFHPEQVYLLTAMALSTTSGGVARIALLTPWVSSPDLGSSSAP